MQAFFLSLVSGIVNTIVGIISPIYAIQLLGALFSTCFGIVTSLISLVVIVMAIIGITKTAQGQDANIPLAKTFAGKAFGLVKNITYSQGNQ